MIAVAMVAALLQPGLDQNQACTTSATADNMVQTSVQCYQPGGSASSGTPGSNTPAPYTDYEWRPACGTDDPGSYVGETCMPLFTCTVGAIPMRLWGLRNGTWVDLGQTKCGGSNNSPTLTPATIATAFAQIPLPHLRSTTQPDTKTLVNFDTIFHVDAHPLTRNLTLLGQHVELLINPSTFTWTFGDGDTLTTTSPGAAYPSRAITHRYQQAHLTVRHHVTITWTARWRLGNGPWDDVPGTVTTTGPTTALQIAEATHLLTGTD